MSEYKALNENADAMRRARQELVAKGFGKSPTDRKKREKKIRSTADGRTLTKTGRVEQLNVRVTPELKKAVNDVSEAEGIRIAELVERFIWEGIERLQGGAA